MFRGFFKKKRSSELLEDLPCQLVQASDDSLSNSEMKKEKVCDVFRKL